MRTKNRPLLLKRAISSVLQQTFTDWHLVVINDGGNQEEIKSILSQFTKSLQKKVTEIHLRESKGMAAASNAGIKATNSQYIALLDDDDTWDSTFLEQTTAFLDRKESSCLLKGVVTYTNSIAEDINSKNICYRYTKKYPLQPKQISLSNLLLENQFTNLSFVYKRDAIDSIGYYDESLLFFDDWDFNIRFAQSFEIGLLPLFLANYHFRIKVKNASGSENALGMREDKALYMSQFRDKKLRNDLKEGVVGIGMMMHLSYQQLKLIPERTSLLKALKHDILWVKNKIRALKENFFCKVGFHA